MEKDIKKTLRSIIQREVQKEVRNVVKREFTELLKEYDLVERKTGNRVIDEELDGFAKANRIIEQERQQEAKSPIQTKNPLLNQVLNETVGGLPGDGGAFDEWRNMMGKEMFDVGDAGMISAGGIDPQYSYMPTPPSSISTMVSPTGKRINPNTPEGAMLDQVMNRDYSELVKRFK